MTEQKYKQMFAKTRTAESVVLGTISQEGKKWSPNGSAAEALQTTPRKQRVKRWIPGSPDPFLQYRALNAVAKGRQRQF